MLFIFENSISVLMIVSTLMLLLIGIFFISWSFKKEKNSDEMQYFKKFGWIFIVSSVCIFVAFILIDKYV